jgi:PAS domain S-box-containing protein
MKNLLSELIDILNSQNLMDQFFKSSGLSTSIKDLKGNVLTNSGGSSLCTDCRYHLSNSCPKSSVTITSESSETIEYILDRCILGLVDGKIKILVKGEHLGNVHVGNFFFKIPDLSFFAEEAKKNSLHESDYLKIVLAIPVIPQNKTYESLQFLSSLVKILIPSYLVENTKHIPLPIQKHPLEQCHLLMGSSLDGIVLLKGSNLVKANQLFFDIFKFSSQFEISGFDFFDLIEPKHKPIVQQNFSSEYPFAFEITGLTYDRKTTVDLQIKSKKVDYDGDIYSIVAVRDISDHKQLVRALDITKQKFEVAFKASPDSININTMDGIYIDINEGFTRLTGYTEADVIGKSSKEIDIWVIRKDRETLVHGLKNHGYISNLESSFRGKDGSIKTAILSARIITIDSKPHILSITRDITDRKLLEDQLNQSQKMESIGRLAGGIAHDFNNLLTVIMGNTELALISLPENAPVREEILEIKNVAIRATNLTKQLLAFCRKQVVDTQVVDINHLIANLDKLLRPIIGEDIDLLIIPSIDPCFTKSDPGQLEQVITNLAINGKDAMSHGGKLTISTSSVLVNSKNAILIGGCTPGDYVLISVTDTGTGIKDDIISKIFEPFFTTKELGKGTGLGLSTCYGIIKQNGGYITVDSIMEKGTTFNIYIPILASDVSISKKRQTFSGLAIGTENVLIAEDESSVRNMVSRTLEKQGYKVIVTIDGQNAKEEIEACNGEIDLVITDVIMPKMGGKELSEFINDNYPNIKVLFMSGYAATSVIDGGIVTNENSFLQKPFTIKALLKKVRIILDKS